VGVVIVVGADATADTGADALFSRCCPAAVIL
jgi:hypothetical protein